jgi:hypothetical protein
MTAQLATAKDPYTLGMAQGGFADFPQVKRD